MSCNCGNSRCGGGCGCQGYTPPCPPRVIPCAIPICSTWIPVLTAESPLIISDLVILEANYCTIGKMVFFRLGLSFTISSPEEGSANILLCTLPLTGVPSEANALYICSAYEEGIPVEDGGRYKILNYQLSISKADQSDWALGDANLGIQGFYITA